MRIVSERKALNNPSYVFIFSVSGSPSPCLFGTPWRDSSVKKLHLLFCWKRATEYHNASWKQYFTASCCNASHLLCVWNRVPFWQRPWAQGCSRWPRAALGGPAGPGAPVGWEAGCSPRAEAVPQWEHYPVLWLGALCWPTADRRLLFFLPFSKFKPYYMTVIANSSFFTFLYELQLMFYFVPCLECREDWSWQDQGSAHEALALYCSLLHFKN